jgi:adenine-specific DNA-methyltransferase
MTDIRFRTAIQDTLIALPHQPLLAGATRLFNVLGYHSERRIDLDDTMPATFAHAFDRDGRLEQRGQLGMWRSIQMIFQISADEVRNAEQAMMDFGDTRFAPQLYSSFLFFAIDMRPKPSGSEYTRTDLATITRELNRLFSMPVSVLFRFPQAKAAGPVASPRMTLAIVTHRPNRQDNSRDVLEKVSLIHAVRLGSPHRAHIAILEEMALPILRTNFAIASFDDLQRAWARTLDISELNRRFYKEIADWYFWAVSQARFPAGAHPREDLRQALSVIRLLTRLIFVWFLKEKNLVPEALFRRADVEKMLNSLEPDESTYYKAILQNLFFATLNTEMNNPRAPRRFRGVNSSGGRDSHHGIASVYRYQAMFRDPQQALDLFGTIPFLNGGLFECLDPDTDRRPETLVEGFSDHADNPLDVPNMLFFGGPANAVDLNRVYGSRGRTFRVRGLNDILNSYKFTVAENTPIEEEVALDPELLGQVFENLLAAYNPETETTARKETGSFYTPRNVVEYMVDESLLLVFRDELQAAAKLVSGINPDLERLNRDLRALLTYNDVEATALFSPTEINVLIAKIDDSKIIDPACGSGAFPMGVLQKLVYVLSKLDHGNLRWKERQTERAEKIPDVEAREAALLAIDEAFERNELDYGRKLFLIENCIYGVDIQPVAVLIAKLRCFISLLVDQRVDDAADNRGVRPLPNLETRFVAANALVDIRRDAPITGQLRLLDPGISRLERDLAYVRSRHFSARTSATKQRYRQRDAELREELGALLRSDGWSDANAQMLSTWNPYSQNASASFFDPEWMFGLTTGFDIVIANPPYVRQEQIKDQKPWLQKQYQEVYTGVADLYVYFYARAARLLRAGGVLTFISSNKFFRAGYGQKLRELLAKHMTIAQIIDFGDASVFTAIAYPSIIVAQKGAPPHPGEPPHPGATRHPSPAHGSGAGGEGQPAGHSLLALSWNPAARLADFPQVLADARRAVTERTASAPLILQQALTSDGWRLEGAATQRLLDKLRRGGKPLGEYVGGRFYRGILTGLNEAFVIDRATRDALIAEHASSEALLKPFLRGRDVKRWRVALADQYLIKIESSENKQHPWSNLPEAKAEQVFAQTYPAIHEWFQPLRAELIKRSDQGNYYWELRSCAYWQEFEQPKIIVPAITSTVEYAPDLMGYFSNDKTSICVTEQVHYLSGLLNSSTLWWYIRQNAATRQGGFYEFKPMYVSQIPIPAAASSSAIEALVTQILTAKAANAAADVAAQERAIDERVYALYGLRPEEVRMIEERVGQ